MTRTPYTLDDLGERLSWRALNNFVRHVGALSALSKEINPDVAKHAWLDGSATAAILADIYDLLNIRTSGSKRKPKPYPRPWGNNRTVRKIGRDPIRLADFAEWWNSKGGE